MTSVLESLIVIINRVAFNLSNKCPECGIDQWFIMDADNSFHCSNCDWSEKGGTIEKRLKIEDSLLGKGLNHQS